MYLQRRLHCLYRDLEKSYIRKKGDENEKRIPRIVSDTRKDGEDGKDGEAGAVARGGGEPDEGVVAGCTKAKGFPSSGSSIVAGFLRLLDLRLPMGWGSGGWGRKSAVIEVKRA